MEQDPSYLIEKLKRLHNELHDTLESDIGACLGGIAGGCGACDLCRWDEAYSNIIKVLKQRENENNN